MALRLSIADYAILALYFVFILGIGWKLRGTAKSAGEFLTAGHQVPVWITSLAFLAANLGAQEVVGMMASGAKYGIMTAHFYWVGAAPAMIFAGIFMMPFYYGSKARSVPEYLRMRFDAKTRALNAATFAVMTIFSSGISMYALGRMFQLVLGWSFHASVLLSATMVLGYTLLGGLTSAIYNEVLQFFLIVAGFTPLSILVVEKAGGWSGIQARLPEAFTHAWRYMDTPQQNPMGIETFGMVAGLGFVLSFGYWCTDFLVVQRALAARSMSAARQTPLIAAFPKMMMPFIVILPGVAALALTKMAGSGYSLPVKGNSYDYDQTLTTLMAQFYPTGMLGVGLTALMASFMSGMAGNVTAFNTVITYDFYQSHIKKDASDHHYLVVGRITTVAGVVLSIAAAYVALRFNNLLDFLELVFSFVNPPLFATFLLGMFWKRATGDGAFWGLLCGTMGAGFTEALSVAEGQGGWIAKLHVFPSQMAQNFWIAIVSWTICFVVTIVVSLMTKAYPREKLVGLVHGVSELPDESGTAWYRRPVTLGIAVGIIVIGLNIWFR